MKCVIKLVWCEDEKFWYSKSMDDRFGLTLESGSLDVLIERVKMAVPEMYEEIGCAGNVELTFEIERVDVLERLVS
jgi:putative aminopeptidase FrvX